ncbi:SufE family protein [Georgenia satyanarayanai]|uniref:SufE family protein n=1 Tax=Georgenia satyanarayanai TaxID=860221 RepID=UPI00203F7549|nr:SufE family protein [Georgenia satyanarayanai]MCM3660613.1 SufE family protein [Georgenia satyanarayanai]
MPHPCLPARLAELVADLTALSVPERLQLLVELGDELPVLPERLRARPELFEPVTECQSPLSVLVELDGGGDDAVVHLHFSAPVHAPVTRGFAGALHTSLDGARADEVLAVPPTMPALLGLEGVVSPLRLGGLTALLARVQRQVAVLTDCRG